MAYLPIEHHGIIGDMNTVALIGIDGCIDWFCFPNFDSPSVFGSLLDDKKGGYYRITPTISTYTSKQIYWPETNVLVTRFLTPEGMGELIDFMPFGSSDATDYRDLVRLVRVVRGSMSFRMECLPAFNYARDPHKTELSAEGAAFFSSNLNMFLASGTQMSLFSHGVAADFTLNEGQAATFYFRDLQADERSLKCPSEMQVNELLKQTVEYWHNWASSFNYAGRWREMVLRSALVLKLLTFQETGAIIASPTTSLPEWIGGGRNWDYRYTWIRDAAFTLYGLLRIGFTDSAARFMDWIQARCHELEPDGSLQTMYGIDGRHELQEEILDHFEGYKGSRPVRIGNAAYRQLQLDIYGELMDAVYLYNKYGTPISYDLWRELRRLLNWVCDNWQNPDEGVWEVRSGRQHFVYSKMMCWVALDRGLRLADKRSFPADRNRWLQARDQIYEEIMSLGWNRDKQAFVQHYGSDSLDASSLIMPLVFFVSPDDPRMLKTLDAIRKSPAHGGLASDSLVFRYNVRETPDGMHDLEGSFNMCSFWLVEAMTRAGYLSEARMLFEKMLGYANHLGLYSEETGPSGEALGNFPQAFTHLGLISAAFNLDRRLAIKGR